MLFRVAISTVLILIGIASPWMVRDWMGAREAGPANDSFYQRMIRLSGEGRQGEGRSQVSLASRAPAELAEEEIPEPYPLATKAKRILQGMLPSNLAVASPSHLLPSSLPKSDHSKAIVRETGEDITESLGKLGLTLGNPIFVRIFKEENELELWMQNPAKEEFTLFKVYRIREWSGSKGPKLKEGDRQCPEGFYFVSASRLRPETRHHLGIDLGFPNDYDQVRGRTGSGLLIHAGTSSAGSYVLNPEDMNELFTMATYAFRSGQSFFRVNAFPFRMTDARMDKEWKAQPKWIDFWVNLKEGYDFFENVNLPPDVHVVGSNYAFQLY